MATIQDVWQRRGTATRVLNTELKKEIIRQRAVDTGRMKNVSKIAELNWDDVTDDITFKINSTFYYKFVQGKPARKWMGGKIPRNITQAFTKREKVKDQLDKLVSIVFEYRIDQQFQDLKL